MVLVPPGVFNLVHGYGGEAGGAMYENQNSLFARSYNLLWVCFDSVGHPQVRLVSFTGGTVTGKIVAASAAPQFKKLSLELG